MDWPEAKTLTDSYDGAQMFVPFNKAMDKSIYDALKSMNRLDGPFWYGLFQDRTANDYSEPAGGWYWVDGVALGSTERAYTNWHSGEPNNAGGNEDYAQFNRFIGGFTWNDMQVGNTQSYALFEFSLKDDGSESNVATVSINIAGDGFNLPENNNKITVGSCTCNGKKDGFLELSVDEINYVRNKKSNVKKNCRKSCTSWNVSCYGNESCKSCITIRYCIVSWRRTLPSR